MVELLLDDVGIREIARQMQVAANTVVKLRLDVGKACAWLLRPLEHDFVWDWPVVTLSPIRFLCRLEALVWRVEDSKSGTTLFWHVADEEPEGKAVVKAALVRLLLDGPEPKGLPDPQRLCENEWDPRFSRLRNLEAQVALRFAWHDFCQAQPDTGKTPVMVAGLEDRVWSLEDLVEWCDEFAEEMRL